MKNVHFFQKLVNYYTLDFDFFKIKKNNRNCEI